MKAESAKKTNNQRSDKRVSNLEAGSSALKQRREIERKLTSAVQTVAQASMMQNLLGQGMVQQQGNYDPHRKASLGQQ